ncbi:ATP-binding protein [Thauera mechernichensis]
MFRPSFRSIMLTAFLLIAGVLAAAAVSGWLSLEALARSIHDGKRNALALTAASRVLGERSVDLERSARQYLVLGEPALRQRFDDALSEAHLALDTLEASAQGLAAPVGEWRALAAAIERGLETTPDGSGTQAAADFSADFLALSQVSEAVERTIQARLARESEDLLAELEYRRHLLAQHILAAVALAGVLAALTSWWLLRPLARMERAIAALGDNHLESPIRIGGPADLRQLGEHLDWLRQRLAELEANRNRVLRHVSHELKTPLASLREGVALLSDGILGQLNAEQREVAGILDSSARALQERIEQLLHYNATQFDARRLDRKPTALLPLLSEVVSEHQLLIQAHKLEVRIEGDAPILSADVSKLRIALSNLIANAIRFSPEHGLIRIDVQVQEPQVIIDCRDDGPGVAEEELERIFEPFFRGSRSSTASTKGSGIGLAIVREFVAAHGGYARALPSPQGAHFQLELPHA